MTKSRPETEAPTPVTPTVQTPAAAADPLPAAFDDPSGRQRRCCACGTPTTRRVRVGERTIALCPTDDTAEMLAKHAGAAREG